jgi:hypothetical protein
MKVPECVRDFYLLAKKSKWEIYRQGNNHIAWVSPVTGVIVRSASSPRYPNRERASVRLKLKREGLAV